MIYECKVYSPNGKLEKTYSPIYLHKRFWRSFNQDSITNIGSLNYLEETGIDKPNRAQTRQTKLCNWCKKVFTPSHQKVKCCGEKCKNEYLNEYFKNRREAIKAGTFLPARRGPHKRKNAPRLLNFKP